MKRITLLLLLTAFSLLLGACHEPKSSAQVQDLKVDPSSLTLKVGEEKELKVTVLPTGTKVSPAFKIDNPSIASINEKGVVKALKKGNAIIVVSAGEKVATCTLSVTDGKTPMIEKNEMPLITLAPNNSPEVLNYETTLGRKLSTIKLGPHDIPCYTNKDLAVITTVAYDVLRPDGSKAIVAFCKEPTDNCPKILAMLEMSGFGNIQRGTFNGLGKGLQATYIKDPSIKASLLPNKNEELGTVALLQIRKERQKFNPMAKDFPSHEVLLSKDGNKIKEFEMNLGLRTYHGQGSEEAKVNLFFITNSAKEKKTNIKTTYYVCSPTEGPLFTHSEIKGIYSPEELSSDKIKEWFATNGFATDYSVDPANKRIVAYTADKKLGAILQMSVQKDNSFVIYMDIAEVQTN